MSSNNDDDDLNVYIYQGKGGEEVPKTVEKLIVRQGVRILPDELCYEFEHLKEVILPRGLIKIGDWTFTFCKNLLEVKNCSTVQYIGAIAFKNCIRLRKVDFETSTSSSPSELRTIDCQAFERCTSLQRIKLPSSVTTIGVYAFSQCNSLVEANLLSTTRITGIFYGAFQSCRSLQTVGLPNTLERIGSQAFDCCFNLVTVIVPLDLQPIEIEGRSFGRCSRLANLKLPKDSTAEENSFAECRLLHERYGGDSSGIIAGLVGRFDGYAIHRMCYDHTAITVQELQECITEQKQGDLLVDRFGMSPLHVLFSTIEPSIDLLDVLLEPLPNQTLLKLKDSNDRRPLDYLMNNWTDGTSSLVQMTLQKWMVDRLASWGATSWMEVIQSKVQDLLAEDNDDERAYLYDELYSDFEHYENVQATSILELALWKRKFKSGWTNDGSKRQALDREECRCLSGSDFVIPQVTMFLDIP